MNIIIITMVVEVSPQLDSKGEKYGMVRRAKKQ